MDDEEKKMSKIIRVYCTDDLLEDIESFMLGSAYHADKYQNELYYLFDLWINCELKRITGMLCGRLGNGRFTSSRWMDYHY